MDPERQLTEQGSEWVRELVRSVQENTRTSSSEIRYSLPERYRELDWIDGGSRAVVELPTADSQGNPLVDDPDGGYVLKIREPRTLDKPPNSRMEDTNPFYTNEVFGEVRIWLEASARGYPGYFAGIIDWDRDSAEWLVQRRAEGISPAAAGEEGRRLKDELRGEDDWIVDDAEVGTVDGRPVFVDFGELWLDDEWHVAETDVARDLSPDS